MAVRIGKRLAPSSLTRNTQRQAPCYAIGFPKMLAIALLTLFVPAALPALDFTAEARLLYQVAACGSLDGSPLPKMFQGKEVEKHCRVMRRRYAVYRDRWLAQAAPFLKRIRPPNIPQQVMYPFGGGDLVSALSTFPDLQEVTTISLEHAGDPRRVMALPAKRLAASLALLRATSAGLLLATDSKTSNLQKGQRGDLPGQLCFFLMALVVHGYEPVRVRYFTLRPDGTVRYLDGETLATLEREDAQLLHKAWISPDFSRAFSNVELVFRKIGSPRYDPTQVRIHRHVAANLGNDGLRAYPALTTYINARAPFSAMTKAASYLLWRDSFSLIRNLLLKDMVFMVSDSTGIPPRFANAGGFRQIAYGNFEGSFLGANEAMNGEFRSLWSGAEPLPFRYGYIDAGRSTHLLVTTRVPLPLQSEH